MKRGNEEVKNILHKDIFYLSKLIKSKQLSPYELTKELLKEIYDKNTNYNAYITIREEEALNEAKIAEESIMKGDYAGPLHGIPLSIKDNIHVKDTNLTNGAIINKSFQSCQDALIVNQLRANKSIIVGKTNMDEYANNISGINKQYGIIKNPVVRDVMAGGSSGGSAASVAANLAFASIGTDTAGSVRIPASCCGLFGLKPTFNIIPTVGIDPLSWTLDHVGFITKSIEDLNIMYHSYVPGQVVSAEPNKQSLNKIKIGVFSNVSSDIDNDAEVKNIYDYYIQKLSNQGIHIKKLDGSFLNNFMEAHLAISSSEAYYFHQQQLQNNPQLYDPANYDYFSKGAMVTHKEYNEALQFRIFINEKFKHIFEEVDCILTPTLPMLPLNINEIQNGWEDTLRKVIKYTSPFNM